MTVKVNSTLEPRTSGYTLLDDNNLAGSLRMVADVAARDLIPDYNRKVGMWVYTEAEGKYWRLLTLAPVWEEVNIKGSGISNTYLVGTVGSIDTDYTSIKEAVEAAVTNGASVNNPYLIVVNPGIYNEDPFEIPAGVFVDGRTNAADSIFVIANVATLDLVTVSGGDLGGVTLSGVTSPIRALIRCTSSGTLSSFHHIGLKNCYNGLWVQNAAMVELTDVEALVLDPSEPVTNVLRVDGLNSNISGTLLNISVPAAVAGMASQNLIQYGIMIEDNSQCSISNIFIDIEPYDNTQAGVYINSGGSGVFGTIFARNNANAALIGAGGSNSVLTVQGGYLIGNDVNINIQSSTGKFFGSGVLVDAPSNVFVAGAVLTGLVQRLDTGLTDLVGPSGIRFATRSAALPKFLRETHGSAVSSGGTVTAGVGLSVDVAAGTGWINRSVPDLSDISWTSATLSSLTANSNTYVFIDDTTLIPAFSVSAPSAQKILLAIVVTGASDVRYVHAKAPQGNLVEQKLQDYLLATLRFFHNTGLGTSQGSTDTKITVDSGSYYIGLELISYDGEADATFSYFYGADGVTEVASQTDIDQTQYDNAGTLTAMTAGFYKSDTLYLTSDGRLSLIYGQAEFALQADAQSANTLIPPPTFIAESGFSLAQVIIQEGVGIVNIVDRRITRSTAVGATFTDHGSLIGLGDDDHTQYLLTSGARPMAGSLDMDGNAIVDAGLINSVDIEAHASRHNPGGIDAIATAVPVIIMAGVPAAEGSAASVARSDHQHSISTSAASSILIGDSAAEGVSSALSRADHKHTLAAPAAPVDVTKSAALAGVSDNVARADHKHDISTAAPASTGVSTASSEGLASSLARSDHTHQSNTAPVNVDGAVAVIGVSGEPARADHKHSLPAAIAPADVTKAAAVAGVSDNVARADHKHDISTAAGSAILVGDAAAEGTATSLSRADHKHALAAPAAPVNVTKAAASAGASGDVARSDHKHDISTAAPSATGVSTASAEGVATTLARSDHSHQSNTAPVNVTKATAAIGTSGEPARADHKHDITTATAGATAIGDTVAEGAATSLSRSDHRHSVAAGTPVATENANAEGAATTFSRSDHVHQTKIDATSASATGAVTTTSLTDVLLTSMSITPGAGNWLVMFSCQHQNSNSNNSNVFSIYVNGVQVARTERTDRIETSNQNLSMYIAALITGVAGGQAVDIRWRVSANTGTVNNRELILVRAV